MSSVSTSLMWKRLRRQLVVLLGSVILLSIPGAVAQEQAVPTEDPPTCKDAESIGAPGQETSSCAGQAQRAIDSSQCGLYMAESSIPGSGLGMYTAKEFDVGEQLFHGDIVINVEDFDVNTKLRRWQNGDFRSDDPFWLLNNYYWNAAVTMAAYEADDIQSIVPGLGMLANSHTGLVNAVMKPPSIAHDHHRSQQAEAGTSSNYHNIHFVADMAIEAGAELFVAYGDDWFVERENDLGMIPLYDDFIEADRLLKEFWRGHGWGGRDPLAAKYEWNKLLDLHSDFPRLLAALPNNLHDVESYMKRGTAKSSVQNRVRSLEWLQENGLCLDNLRPGPSTLERAGRGAFATRPLKKGDVIAPMPMVHVLRSDLEIYDSDNYHEYSGDVWRVGTQLLLNYVYGHADSSLLLFPYSPVVNYLNHGGKKKANAELRWSKLSHHQQDWLKRSPEDLATEDHSGLLMELVATRDIAADEEVLIDYGPAWEKAWNEYQKNWKPPEDAEGYLSAAEMNDRHEPIKTMDELENGESEDNLETIFTVCFVAEFVKNPNVDKTAKHPHHYRWHQGAKDLYDTTNDAYFCDVVERTNVTVKNRDGTEVEEERYTAVVERENDDGVRLKSTVAGIPREAIRYFDGDYTSDQFLRDTFRHEIALPDRLVPKAWLKS